MCTAFMAGVLLAMHYSSKCTQETPPLKTFAIDYICLSAWRNFQEYFRYQQNRQNRRQGYSKSPSCYTITS